MNRAAESEAAADVADEWAETKSGFVDEREANFVSSASFVEVAPEGQAELSTASSWPVWVAGSHNGFFDRLLC